MIEMRGDLFEPPLGHVDAVCITTNGYRTKAGKAVMGRGVAGQAKQRWPGIDGVLGKAIEQFGNSTRLLTYEKDGRFSLVGRWVPVPYHVVSLPVKHHWAHAADSELIRSSCRDLRLMSIRMEWGTVVLPRPGCGNGGLKWADVRPIVEQELGGEAFVVIEKY